MSQFYSPCSCSGWRATDTRRSILRTATMGARLACVIGVVSLWSETTAARQSAALPRNLRAHVQNERFDAVSSLGGLPGGVRAELRTLFGGQTPDIADPAAPFQGASETANSKLPLRRLVAAGCSREDC